MTVPTASAHDAAALWAARLEGSDLSATDRQDLQHWLEADPAHRDSLSGYCQFSADLEEPLAAFAAAGRIVPAVAPAPARRRPWQFGLALAGLAAAAIVTVVWIVSPTTQFANVATPVGQRQSLALADGSQVELDARTSLRIELDQTVRRIRLAEGQAFFAVTKDPDRPFVVETPAGAVRVRGTRFDVRNFDDDELVVTVAEGVVQISPAGNSRSAAPFTLRAGDQLVVDSDGERLTHLDPAGLEDALAWREGYVVFEGSPLATALRRFGRHHGIGISCSAGAADLRVGGRFALDDLNGFFVALEEVLPVRVDRGLNGTIRVTTRDESR